MGKLFLWDFMSLDGVVESPEKWVTAYQSPDVYDFIKIQNLECDALLLGRMTYEAFITFWPFQTNNEFGFADKLNKMPKFVVSSTLEKADWNNTSILAGNVIEEVTKLKGRSSDEKIGITGSPTLVQALIKHDLIDEFRLMIYPIVLGTGKRLFRDDSNINLKLVETRPFKSGVVALSYQLERQ
jgi:dihydrofolate reductase